MTDIILIDFFAQIVIISLSYSVCAGYNYKAMISEDDISKMDNVVEDIYEKRDFYLSKFGAFTERTVGKLLHLRNPKIYNPINHQKLSSHFKSELMRFSIKHPNLLRRSFKYPFLEVLASINAAKTSPQAYSISWIGERHFVDVSSLPSHLSKLEFNKLKINALCDTSLTLAQDEKELVGDKEFWITEEDVALAMLEDIDPLTLKLQGNWFQILLEKKCNKEIAKDDFSKKLKGLLSPTGLLKCFNEDFDSDNLESKNLSKPIWLSLFRSAIKDVFIHLGAHSRNEALRLYLRIIKALSESSYGASRDDTLFSQKLAFILRQKSQYFDDIIKQYNSRIYIKGSDFITIFKDGIIEQSKPFHDKDIYAEMLADIEVSKKKLNRMALSGEQRARYSTLLEIESAITFLSAKKPPTTILELKARFEGRFKNGDITLDIIETAFKQNNPLNYGKPNAESQTTESSIWASLSKGIFTDQGNDDVPIMLTQQEKKLSPFKKTTLECNDFLTFDLKSLYKASKAKPTYSYDDQELASILPNLGFHKIVSLKDRAIIMAAVNEGEIDAIKDMVLSEGEKLKQGSAFSYQSALKSLNRIGALLLLSISAPSYKSIHHRDDVIKIFAEAIMDGVNYSKSTFTMLASISITEALFLCIQRQDLHSLYVLRDSTRPISYINNNGNEYGLNSYTRFDLIGNMNKAIFDIPDPTIRRHYAILALGFYEKFELASGDLINFIVSESEKCLEEIKEDDTWAANNLLRAIFSKTDISPYEYLITCKDWQKPAVLDILSEF
tara:strand:- start:3619 stop:5967 length:2349 start_codon:yes stop_codon:yes gene_type:complete